MTTTTPHGGSNPADATPPTAPTAAGARPTEGAARAETATSTSPLAPEHRAVTLGMVALVALAAFEQLAVTTTMPSVVDALGGLSLYAMAFAAPVAAGVLGMVAAGGWADRRGHAQPLLTGVALFVIGLVVAGTATTMETVVGGRLVQGLGSGMFTVALYVLVARRYPDAVQPRVFSAFAAAWILPSIVGPAIAGAIAEHLGWRWVFLAVPLLTVPALLALRPALHPTPRPATHPDEAQDGGAPRPGGRVQLLRAAAAGAGALALHRGGQPELWEHADDRTVAIATLALGLALLALGVPRLLPRGTLRAARGLPTVVLVRGLTGAAFFGAEVYLPLLLITERGLSQAVAGLALTGAALLWSAGSWLRGRNEGRWDDRRVLQLGALALGVGIALAALGVWTAVPVAVSMVGWGLSGLGMGVSYPTLSVLTLRLSAPSEQGANSSALQVNESLTVALVLAASGPLFAVLLPVGPVAAFLACFGLAGGLAILGSGVAGRVRAA